MAMIIDRRVDGRNKSAVNRQRLIKRYKRQIKKAVSEAVTKRSITDIGSGEKVNIPTRDVAEPVIHHGRGGVTERVYSGNKEFVKGDQIERPKQQSGQAGGGEGSNSGEAEDDFAFEISKDEYLDLLFEELALPNLVKKSSIVKQASKSMVRAGFSNTGVPANLNLIRTMRRAKGRKIAIAAPYRQLLSDLRNELEQELERTPTNEARIKELREKIGVISAKIASVPFIDTYDLKFNQYIAQPKPVTQAVMFCIMDVSSSMSQETKDIAKRFFILLYLFLSRSYEKTDVVFIRHHTSAEEVDEQTFFYSRESGGTIVSSALKMTADIIRQRYPINDWNIYAAQASDGDDWIDDIPLCSDLLSNTILPLLQYYAYVEINNNGHHALWKAYESIEQRFESFAMRQIASVEEIYPVFHELFKRKEK
ncbi:MAG: YeaH/YhbH family protein [Chromatiaceae bacterium]|nr:YeaH/YhbH family protein [Gammaproteobacteria bacterium]MCP5448694.1 YeaH/YhbH family protein [Chromatiaceae bacterium]